MRQGRRGALFGDDGGAPGTSSSQRADPESLEKQNDVEIADIGDRVSLLKNLTHNLHTEADSQNSVLRGMADGFANTRGMLAQTVQNFEKKVKRHLSIRPLYLVVGFTTVLLLVWWFLFRRSA